MERTSPDYARAVQRVLIVTLVLNLLVVAGKLVAGLLAGSLSVISDAIHSSVDSLNNVVGLVITRYASAEPDENHPYGHAKFETLAAFVIAGFLFVTCYQIGLSAIGRLMGGASSPPEITSLTIWVMVVTLVVNLIVTIYETREGRRWQSEFLLADAVHTRSDIVISLAILVGLFFVDRGMYWLDPALSLGVAIFIAWSGYQIFIRAVPVLVDEAPVPPARIAAIAESVAGVHSVHDIRSRSHGGAIFVEMHMHIDPTIEHDAHRAHAVTEEVEEQLQSAFGRVTATIHVEPLDSSSLPPAK